MNIFSFIAARAVGIRGDFKMKKISMKTAVSCEGLC